MKMNYNKLITGRVMKTLKIQGDKKLIKVATIEALVEDASGVVDVDVADFQTQYIVSVLTKQYIANNAIIKLTCAKDQKGFYVASKIETLEEQTVVEITNFIKRNFTGLGAVAAKKIANAFGSKFLEACSEEIDKVLTPAKAKAFKDQQQALRFEFTEYHKLIQLCGDLDLVNKLSRDRIGYDTVVDNPFLIDGIQFSQAFDIYVFYTYARDKEFKKLIDGCIIKTLKYNQQLGNLYIFKDTLFQMCNDTIIKIQESFKDAIDFLEIKTNITDFLVKHFEDRLKELILNNKIILEDNRISYYNTYYKEKQLAKILKYYAETVYSETIEKDGFLNEAQNEALNAAINNKLMVLTGGPGTGKTQTINSIANQFAKMGKTIAMVAPTGKASRRMTQLTGRNAQTLHSKLEMITEEGDVREIVEDVVVVDEASMTDIFLFYGLMRACQNVSNIIIVGDVNQIPSVGPGSILKDLINSGVVKTVRLTKTYRQKPGSEIINNARLVLDGKCDLKNGSDFNIINCNTEQDVLNSISQILKDKPNAQLLIAGKAGITGVNNVNSVIQASTKTDIVKITNSKQFAIGDKVIQTRNDYSSGTMNGDIGFVKSILDDSVVVEFDSAIIRTYNSTDIVDLDLAYAITIHKSQGSEWDDVVIVCNTFAFATRQLLYTAITRAKKHVTILNLNGNMDKMIEKCDTERQCNLIDFLQK